MLTLTGRWCKGYKTAGVSTVWEFHCSQLLKFDVYYLARKSQSLLQGFKILELNITKALGSVGFPVTQNSNVGNLCCGG